MYNVCNDFIQFMNIIYIYRVYGHIVSYTFLLKWETIMSNYFPGRIIITGASKV